MRGRTKVERCDRGFLRVGDSGSHQFPSNPTIASHVSPERIACQREERRWEKQLDRWSVDSKQPETLHDATRKQISQAGIEQQMKSGESPGAGLSLYD
jgi:hypothetical protein